MLILMILNYPHLFQCYFSIALVCEVQKVLIRCLWWLSGERTELRTVLAAALVMPSLI